MIKTDFRPITVDRLRTRILDFETHYGVPSERMTEAFMHQGKLVETDDLHEWSQLVATLEVVSPPRP